MHGIYNYIPAKNHVSRVYPVAAVLCLQCATCNVISHVKYVLDLYISIFRSLCGVVQTAVFCSSLILCFPGLSLRYSLGVTTTTTNTNTNTATTIIMLSSSSLATGLFTLVRVLLSQRWSPPLRFQVSDCSTSLLFVMFQVWLSFVLSICLSIYLSIYLSTFLPICLSVRPSVRPPARPPARLSVRLSVCLHGMFPWYDFGIFLYIFCYYSCGSIYYRYDHTSLVPHSL